MWRSFPLGNLQVNSQVVQFGQAEYWHQRREISTGEFACPDAVDLFEYRLEFWNGSTTTLYNAFSLLGTLAPGDFHVVCASGLTVPNCDQDVSPDANLLQNGAPDTDDNSVDIFLRCATPGEPNAPAGVNCEDPVAVDDESWGTIKALFR